MAYIRNGFRATITIALLAHAVACSKTAPPDTSDTIESTSAADHAAAAAPANDPGELLSAKVIHWSVVGDYTGEVLVLDVGTSGYAPVTDHVEIGFDYTSEGNGGLVGTPAFVDSTSQLGALRNGARGCRAPLVTGHYEHSSIESITNGLGGQLAMQIRTDYPEGSVPVACTGGNQASPAHSESTQVDFLVPSVALLSMGDQMPAGDISVSRDKRSIIIKTAGWTYTYTPTRLR